MSRFRTIETTASTLGLAVASCFVVAAVSAHGYVLGMITLALLLPTAGFAATRIAHALQASDWAVILPALALVGLLPWAAWRLLYLPIPGLAPALFVTGALVASVLHHRQRARATVAVSLGAVLLTTTSALPVGAWSVDDPRVSNPDQSPGNGINVEVDTHALLLKQGVEILKNDGYTEIADFLNSADTNAPFVRDLKSGKQGTERQSYLWRMQTASRDADRANKSKMPDHFFNWFTHSGKGLIAGPSAATYAEKQHDLAVTEWQRGNYSKAMYYLGAATHLVQDACTPPHTSQFVPNHRPYEEWAVRHLDEMEADSGGIYQAQLAATAPHGGGQWSVEHTRGWLDACAHRAWVEIPNTMQPPSEDPLLNDAAAKETARHFKETQQITAGYLKFFFDEVGGFSQ